MLHSCQGSVLRTESTNTSICLSGVLSIPTVLPRVLGQDRPGIIDNLGGVSHEVRSSRCCTPRQTCAKSSEGISDVKEQALL